MLRDFFFSRSVHPCILLSQCSGLVNVAHSCFFIVGLMEEIDSNSLDLCVFFLEFGFHGWN